MNKITELEAVKCKNCSHEYHGIYCPLCGQRHIAKRITVKESIRTWIGVLINLEKGVWPTSWLMIKNPSKVINDYLNGITRPYAHPFRFLFLWLTIQVFLMFSTGVFDLTQGSVYEGMQGEQVREMSQGQLKLMQAIKQYMQLFLVLSMPFLAVATRMFFRKRKFNFAEHLVISSYAYGTSLLISIFLIPFYMLDREYALIAQLAGALVSIAYLAYVYSKVFYNNYVVAFLKSTGVMIFWFIGMAIIIMLILLVVIAIQAILDPQILQNFNKPAS